MPARALGPLAHRVAAGERLQLDRRGVADVQSVTVAETTGERYLGGFFALSFDGQDTQALPYDASAAAVEAAGVGLIVAAPTGMGVLTESGPPGWHPARKQPGPGPVRWAWPSRPPPSRAQPSQPLLEIVLDRRGGRTCHQWERWAP